MRFAGSSVFEQLFTQVLARCRERGLLDGERLVVDATHVEADAALTSLRAKLRGAADHEDAGEDGCPGPEAPPQLTLAAPRQGPTPRRRATNATACSRTDPNAKLRHKPGHRPHLVHRAQVATDSKARVVVAVVGERATGHEGDALATLVGRARWAGHAVGELAADKGYASQATYPALGALGVCALIPPEPNMLGHVEGRAARERCHSARGHDAAIDRQAHAEGAICELKLRHAPGRARCRGTTKFHLQLTVAATALNPKRLVERQYAAEQIAAGHANDMTGLGIWTYEVSLN